MMQVEMAIPARVKRERPYPAIELQ